MVASKNSNIISKSPTLTLLFGEGTIGNWFFRDALMKGFYAVLLFAFICIDSLAQPIPAAEQLDVFLPLLKGKKVGLVVNQTSLVKGTHLLDTLLWHKVQVVRIFGPEHGFRGNADAGEKVNNALDARSGLPVVSLYGKNKKPTSEQIADLDILIFDIQDVGCRFYTYISTLHYVMEACAENGKTLIILDRPNPNGMYIDGPVLDTAYHSFVGIHPVPIVHGMTIGEYAKMINGERWISEQLSVTSVQLPVISKQLYIIPCKNYTHKDSYSLPVKPSPNLPNDLSIALYPSLCLFEGTNVSVARGTFFPFQAIGFPDSTYGGTYFVPESIAGMAKEPMYLGKKCYGIDLRSTKPERRFTLKYVIDFYNQAKDKEAYFNKFFYKLIGNNQVIQQIKECKTEQEIRKSWQPALEKFKLIRKKYLLYPDF